MYIVIKIIFLYFNFMKISIIQRFDDAIVCFDQVLQLVGKPDAYWMQTLVCLANCYRKKQCADLKSFYQKKNLFFCSLLFLLHFLYKGIWKSFANLWKCKSIVSDRFFHLFFHWVNLSSFGICEKKIENEKEKKKKKKCSFTFYFLLLLFKTIIGKSPRSYHSISSFSFTFSRFIDHITFAESIAGSISA